jgi:hypothetical protein
MPNTINSAIQCSVMLSPPCNGSYAATFSVQSIIHAEGVKYRGGGSIRTMSGSNSGE